MSIKIGGNIDFSCDLTPEQEIKTFKDLFGDKGPTAEDFANMLGTWIDPKDPTTLKVRSRGDRINVTLVCNSEDWLSDGSRTKATISRTFRKIGKGKKAKLHVHHDLLDLNPLIKGSGVGSEILKNSFAYYEELGVETVDQICAWDGRYVWARMGYEMDPNTFERAKATLPGFLAKKIVKNDDWGARTKESVIKKVSAWVEENVKNAQDIADLRLPDGTEVGKELMTHDEFPSYKAKINLDKNNPNYKRMRDYLTGNKPERVAPDLTVEEEMSPDSDDWGDLEDLPPSEEDKKPLFHFTGSTRTCGFTFEIRVVCFLNHG